MPIVPARLNLLRLLSLLPLSLQIPDSMRRSRYLGISAEVIFSICLILHAADSARRLPFLIASVNGDAEFSVSATRPTPLRLQKGSQPFLRGMKANAIF